MRNKRRTLDHVVNTTTVIGAGVIVSGDLRGTDNFIIHGEVRGNCELDGPLTLGPGGRWLGDINAKDVFIAGEVEGVVSAQAKIELGKTARVKGNLLGGSIAVAEGASIEGHIKINSENKLIQFQEKRKRA